MNNIFIYGRIDSVLHKSLVFCMVYAHAYAGGNNTADTATITEEVIQSEIIFYSDYYTIFHTAIKRTSHHLGQCVTGITNTENNPN